VSGRSLIPLTLAAVLGGPAIAAAHHPAGSVGSTWELLVVSTVALIFIALCLADVVRDRWRRPGPRRRGGA
jgi:hypothetical protein